MQDPQRLLAGAVALLRRLVVTRKLPIAAAVLVLMVITVNHLTDNAVGDAVWRPTPIPDDPPGAWDHHPVVLLHQQAEIQHQAFLNRQSRNPDEAEEVYRRRYAMDPPPGYRRWVEYALASGSPVIDDFDMIAEGVHPFLKHTAADLKARIEAVRHDPLANQVGLCRFEGGKFTSGCRMWGPPMNLILGGAGQHVPDVELLINFLDEPSLLPTAEAARHNGTAAAASPWADLGRHSIAAAVNESCVAQGRTPRADVPPGGDYFGIPFVADPAGGRDLCGHPEFETQHGFVACPTTLKRLASSVPILSQSAPHPFTDIVFPSHLYARASNQPAKWSDRLWGSKRNAAYWAGSTTGGEWSSATWRSGLRQRLVMLATGKAEGGGGDGNQATTVLRHDAASNTVVPQQGAPVDTSMFEVRLTNMINCDAEPAACDEQRRFFGVPGDRHPGSRALRYQLALDLDGNSFSMRFYRFLASRSCPLKVTVFREWHDERLRPWLHYIPVSVGMRELPELVRFLTRTAAGQRVARRVAEAGREWYPKAVSPPHQGIYLYRLMLEMARLQDDGRKAA
ncbi:hypothetical protein GGTG_13121 [Gaeumannomyces tritici R3-111a-1]|uniref:Glycosyl transferase CAP10 domain-containing protein n=1 Tax=Gaeumannomyces tritici (strain R3-111a-1) TaxID=644352 RepID=J3PHZ0_GAET3|nr:hypothetical protein GGTG_13121 [Gaeumannomyces tritici R3-111a-1]EJT69502.1 hypothetical protein GGTG_13121 [Gaeumannomyces tritici R3-111a-1]